MPATAVLEAPVSVPVGKRELTVAPPPVSLTASARAQLTPDDVALLQQAVTSKYDCMHNKSFDRADADKLIYAQAVPVPAADVSWYVPVMERLSDGVPSNLENTLLTPAQEKAVFLQFNYCRYQVLKLRKQVAGRAISLKAARGLIAWHQRAQAHRDQIAGMNLALVLAMIKRMRLTEMDFSDLISEGNMALLRAIDKFDVARGFKFSTYACRAIIKAFSRFGTRHSRLRRMFPVEFDPEFEKSDYLERKNEEVEGGCVEELRRIIRENKAELTEVEREIIEHRFAIGAASQADRDLTKALTLQQVGELVGLTKERVRQIQNNAMEKLRQALDRSILA